VSSPPNYHLTSAGILCHLLPITISPALEYRVIPSQLPFNQRWNTMSSPPNCHSTSTAILCHSLPITIQPAPEYHVIPSQLPFIQHWNTVSSPPNYHLTSAGILCHPLPIAIQPALQYCHPLPTAIQPALQYCVIPSLLPFNQRWNTVSSPLNCHSTSTAILCHSLPITI